MDGLTSREKDLVHKMALVWNEFLQLPVEHPADLTEMQSHIHAAQYLILARPGRRELNQVAKL